MTETPDQMIRRILAELYPTPSPYAKFTEAVQKFGEAIGRLSIALRSAPAEPCRLCGCWGGHHDGCALGERC